MPEMHVLSLAAAQDKAKLSSGDAWLLLLDVIWQGQHLRLARNPDAVTFDAGDGAGPQSYQPFNFDVGMEHVSQGQLPSISLTASNVGRILQGVIEQYSGAVGASANIYVVNTAHPGGEPDLAIATTIMRVECTAEQVSMTLGLPSPIRALFPRYLYRANFCMWLPYYSSPARRAAGAPYTQWCGYTGALTSCSGTLDGPNGCTAHANSNRFGAFPGIGTNGAAIASQL